MSQEDKLIRIRQKSDTAENWVLNNPVLLYGELGLEIDTQKIKMGDGVTPWTGLRYVMQDVADNMNNKANTDLSNVSALTTTVKDTLGVATKNHAVSNTNYGVATTSYYGHVRTGGFTGSGHYVQSRRSAASLSNFNSTTYLYPGEYPVYFYTNATNAPSTISGDTGINSTSTYIYGIIKTDNYYTGSYSSSYGVKQTLIIPRYNVAYERCCYQGSSTYGTWEKIGNFEMPEDIQCNTIRANSGAVGNMAAGSMTVDSNLTAQGTLKGLGAAEFWGRNINTGEECLYATGPLTAPLYVGTISGWWVFEDWASEQYSPYIEVRDSTGEGEIVYYGYLTEKFSPSTYDIIISFDDSTMSNYYSEIAECGLYVRTNGTMGIGNYEAFQNSSLYYNKVTLGINITIYYTGGGVL